jgi:L-ascorbate metabolism protein UlaG (beta-lactamase superfamily)
MKLARSGLFAFLLCAQIARAGLPQYSALIVSDANRNAAPPRDGLRVTYLGVNGYCLETGGHALLVDPYFSRVEFWPVAFNQPIAPKPAQIDQGFVHLPPAIDAVLVTHAHFDHLLDVPEILKRTGARLLSGPTAVNLVQSLGVPPQRCESASPGVKRQIGPWTIHVLAAQHDRLFGATPFPGRIPAKINAPSRPSDWKVGEPLAFIIEAGQKRIYLDSGGLPGSPTVIAFAPVDLAILGVALPDSRERYAEIVRQLQPRYILPSHQDDFFAPLNGGFVFGKMTNFPDLLRQQRKQNLPGRLILLDYFKPWTVP